MIPYKNTVTWICELCEQSFMLRSYLIRHMLTHTEKPFSCRACNKKFKTRQERIIHNKICHKSPEFDNEEVLSLIVDDSNVVHQVSDSEGVARDLEPSPTALNYNTFIKFVFTFLFFLRNTLTECCKPFINEANSRFKVLNEYIMFNFLPFLNDIRIRYSYLKSIKSLLAYLFDVVSDLRTAYEHILNGDYWWGIFTVLCSMPPMLISSFICMLAIILETEKLGLRNEFREEFFLFMLPVRFVLLVCSPIIPIGIHIWNVIVSIRYRRVLLPNTLHQYQHQYMKSAADAVAFLRLCEILMETYPQCCLQIYILLHTLYLGKDINFWVLYSIIKSLITLALSLSTSDILNHATLCNKYLIFFLFGLLAITSRTVVCLAYPASLIQFPNPSFLDFMSLDFASLNFASLDFSSLDFAYLIQILLCFMPYYIILWIPSYLRSLVRQWYLRSLVRKWSMRVSYELHISRIIIGDAMPFVIISLLTSIFNSFTLDGLVVSIFTLILAAVGYAVGVPLNTFIMAISLATVSCLANLIFTFVPSCNRIKKDWIDIKVHSTTFPLQNVVARCHDIISKFVPELFNLLIVTRLIYIILYVYGIRNDSYRAYRFYSTGDYWWAGMIIVSMLNHMIISSIMILPIIYIKYPRSAESSWYKLLLTLLVLVSSPVVPLYFYIWNFVIPFREYRGERTTSVIIAVHGRRGERSYSTISINEHRWLVLCMKLTETIFMDYPQLSIRLYVSLQLVSSFSEVTWWKWILILIRLMNVTSGVTRNQILFVRVSRRKRRIFFVFGMLSVISRLFVACLWSMIYKPLYFLPIYIELLASSIVWSINRYCTNSYCVQLAGFHQRNPILVFTTWILTATFNCFNRTGLLISTINLLIAVGGYFLGEEPNFMAIPTLTLAIFTCLINFLFVCIPRLKHIGEDWLSKDDNGHCKLY